jgi:hypothetical protein
LRDRHRADAGYLLERKLVQKVAGVGRTPERTK